MCYSIYFVVLSAWFGLDLLVQSQRVLDCIVPVYLLVYIHVIPLYFCVCVSDTVHDVQSLESQPLHSFLDNLPHLQHDIITSPLSNNARSNRPVVLAQTHRHAHRRQTRKGRRYCQHVLHVRAEIARHFLCVEQRCSLDRGRVEENVYCVVGEGILRGAGGEDVPRAEHAVEVGANKIARALGLEEVVVEGAATGRFSAGDGERRANATYSAVKAYVPSRIRRCTSGPNPCERVWA